MTTTLTRSKDRKVANAVSKSGNPTIANTFGLPSGKGYSCASQTPFCESICYAGKLERQYTAVVNVLLRNFNLLKDENLGGMFSLLNNMIKEFVAECDKKGAAKLFRIHWDGDFFSPVYVHAWSEVIAAHPDVTFWCYTRVQTAAVYLHSKKHSNLSLYFSADPDNVQIANNLQAMGIKIAFVGKTFAEGKDQFPTATRCPENNKAMPLISDKGSACARCGLCVNGRKNVLFSATKK